MAQPAIDCYLQFPRPLVNSLLQANRGGRKKWELIFAIREVGLKASVSGRMTGLSKRKSARMAAGESVDIPLNKMSTAAKKRREPKSSKRYQPSSGPRQPQPKQKADKPSAKAAKRAKAAQVKNRTSGVVSPTSKQPAKPKSGETKAKPAKAVAGPLKTGVNPQRTPAQRVRGKGMSAPVRYGGVRFGSLPSQELIAKASAAVETLEFGDSVKRNEDVLTKYRRLQHNRDRGQTVLLGIIPNLPQKD